MVRVLRRTRLVTAIGGRGIRLLTGRAAAAACGVSGATAYLLPGIALVLNSIGICRAAYGTALGPNREVLVRSRGIILRLAAGTERVVGPRRGTLILALPPTSAELLPAAEKGAVATGATRRTLGPGGQKASFIQKGGRAEASCRAVPIPSSTSSRAAAKGLVLSQGAAAKG